MIIFKLIAFAAAVFFLGLSGIGYLIRCPFHATLYLVAGLGAVATGVVL